MDGGSRTHKMETGKPVAVLAGWLGCQPRNLRRYSDMYDRYGWATVIGIGSAQSVVAAMTEGPFSCQTSESEDDADNDCSNNSNRNHSQRKHPLFENM